MGRSVKVDTKVEIELVEVVASLSVEDTVELMLVCIEDLALSRVAREIADHYTKRDLKCFIDKLIAEHESRKSEVAPSRD